MGSSGARPGGAERGRAMAGREGGFSARWGGRSHRSPDRCVPLAKGCCSFRVIEPYGSSCGRVGGVLGFGSLQVALHGSCADFCFPCLSVTTVPSASPATCGSLILLRVTEAAAQWLRSRVQGATVQVRLRVRLPVRHGQRRMGE
ncbi:unnamed protein product [Coccothraustes coccothraustes]